MIDHGTSCAGDPCTCSCYTRHEPTPGVHQDTPHPSTQCMEGSTLDYCCVDYYRNGTTHGGGCKASNYRKLSDRPQA